MKMNDINPPLERVRGYKRNKNGLNPGDPDWVNPIIAELLGLKGLVVALKQLERHYGVDYEYSDASWVKGAELDALIKMYDLK